MIIRRGTYAYDLIKTILQAGAASGITEQIISMPSKSHMVIKAETALRKQDVIAGGGRGATRSITLKMNDEKKKERLEQIYSRTLLRHYEALLRSGNQTEKWRRRSLRMSEVIAMLNRLGTVVFEDEKFIRTWDESQERRDYYDRYVPHFFDAKNIREMNEGKPPNGYTRVCGILASPGGIYAVYNFGKEGYSWNNMGEESIAYVLNDIVRHYYPSSREEDDTGKIKDTVVFGVSEELAVQYLIESGFRKRKKKRKANAKNSEVYEEPTIANRVYLRMHYIPFTLSGMYALRVLMMRDWQQKLYTLYPCIRLGREDEPFHAICEIREGREHSLYFFDCDLHKLYDFVAHAPYTPAKCVIYCYDWQKHIVDAIINELHVKGISVSTFSPENITSFFKKEWEREEIEWENGQYYISKHQMTLQHAEK